MNGEPDRLLVQGLGGGPALEVLRRRNLLEPVWSNDGSELMVYSEGAVHFVPRLGGPTRQLNTALSRRSWSRGESRFAGINPGRKWIRIVDKFTGEGTVRLRSLERSRSYRTSIGRQQPMFCYSKLWTNGNVTLSGRHRSMGRLATENF